MGPPMNTSFKVAILTAVIAVIAFPLEATGPAGAWWGAIWPWPTIHHNAPAGVQLALFMLLGVFEAVALGLAVSFLVFGWPLVKRVSPTTPGALAMYLSSAWVLGNWWMHDSLHFTNSEAPGSLLVIEYGFHVTLIIAGATLCYQLYRAWNSGRLASPATARARSI